MKAYALVAVVFILVGAGFLYFSANPVAAPGPVACTLEAMQCPDGSYVGRTGPNCEFICPGANSTTDGTTGTGQSGGGGIAAYQSGIKGTVMAGPTCPVERNPPDPACADRPLQTLVAVYRKSDLVHAVAFAQSSAQGEFAFSLAPGEYTVGAGESNLPRCNLTPATVGPAGYTTIVISCDTGIR